MMEDDKIIELYLKRDEAAIKNTSEKYGTRLMAVANNILGDNHLAEECVNDTFYSAWNSIPPHEPYNYFFSFLAKITRNIALDCFQKGKRIKRSAVIVELTSELEQCLPSVEDTERKIDEIEFGRTVSNFLRGLTKEQRQVFVRRYWYMDSIGEISKKFDMSESKVRSILFRIRKQLKNYLEKEAVLNEG